MADGMDIVVKIDGEQMGVGIAAQLRAAAAAGQTDYTRTRFFRPESVQGMPPVRLFGEMPCCPS